MLFASSHSVLLGCKFEGCCSNFPGGENSSWLDEKKMLYILEKKSPDAANHTRGVDEADMRPWEGGSCLQWYVIDGRGMMWTAATEWSEQT